MIERPRAAIASRVALAMLGAIFVSACDSGAKLDVPQERDTLQLAPVIIVTKSEITYEGKPAMPPDPIVAVDCDAVAAKVPGVLFAYDPGYFNFAAKIRPEVRKSCVEDAWPEPLRRCIVTTKPDALAHDHACEYLVSHELAERVAKRFGIPADSLPQAASSPTTTAQ